MLYTALIFGLLGSFHCIGMCGPIAFLLPVDRSNTKKKILQIGSYHFGRILSYGILGLVFGLVGKSLNLFGFQQQLSIAIGVLMILFILIPKKYYSKYTLNSKIYTIVAKVKSAIGLELKNKKPSTFFTIGYLNGFLPCGLVYMAVFGALATRGALQGSLYMVFFGIGTIPLMTAAIYVGKFLTGNAKKTIRKAIPIAVVCIGVLFVLRGLGLAIPYISPSQNVAIEKVSSVHSCH